MYSNYCFVSASCFPVILNRTEVLLENGWIDSCMLGCGIKNEWRLRLINQLKTTCRLKEAQLSVKKITEEKKVETRKLNPNSLVRRRWRSRRWTWMHADGTQTQRFIKKKKKDLENTNRKMFLKFCLNWMNKTSCAATSSVYLINSCVSTRKSDCDRKKPTCPQIKMQAS